MIQGLAKNGLRIVALAIVIFCLGAVRLFAQNPQGPRFPQTPQNPQDSPAQPAPADGESLRPRGNDYSAESLRRYHRAFRAQFGPSARQIPLEAKAEHLEWALTRYHWTPYDHINPRLILPEEPGQPPEYRYAGDGSTWNGVFLGTLCYKYAVTKDPETLAKICRMLDGMHFFLEVTGQPGLPARLVLRQDAPVADCDQPYIAPDGTKYFYRSDAAKGTLNQIIGGYCVLMMLVWPDLPPEKQRMARDDLQAMVYHLIAHDYQLTEKDGEHTEFGDLRPLALSQSIPFNAQVAYMIVATGAYFPGGDRAAHRRIQKEFTRLRDKHHVYYESPRKTWLPLILPQRVGDNPLVKGMNDRNHVLNAAYWGLMLERWAARREGRKVHGDFTYQLGRTMFWTMHHIQNHGNALCNLMWAGILSDPQMFGRIIPENRPAIQHQVQWLKNIAYEQLRRFPVERFYEPGEKVPTRLAQWVDARKKHDSYLWKSDPFYRWQTNGKESNIHIASLDFLHAYWLMRYWGLDPDRAAVENPTKTSRAE